MWNPESREQPPPQLLCVCVCVVGWTDDCCVYLCGGVIDVIESFHILIITKCRTGNFPPFQVVAFRYTWRMLLLLLVLVFGFYTVSPNVWLEQLMILISFVCIIRISLPTCCAKRVRSTICRPQASFLIRKKYPRDVPFSCSVSFGVWSICNVQCFEEREKTLFKIFIQAFVHKQGDTFITKIMLYNNIYYIYIYIYTNIVSTHMLSHTHTRTHACTNTHTHTHTHTQDRPSQCYRSFADWKSMQLLKIVDVINLQYDICFLCLALWI